MTVRDWIERRPEAAPASLTESVLRALGPDANADETRTAEVCLDAAARTLEALLAANRFRREHASDLLAIDALTTYAFEFAAQARDAADHLMQLTDRGTRMFGRLMAQRV